MAWSTDLEFEGLPRVNLSRLFGITAGLYIQTPEVQAAIRSRDSRILDVLNLVLDDHEELVAIYDLSDRVYAEWALRENPAQLERQARLILQSRYANDWDRRGAQDILDALEKKQRKQKAKQTKASLVSVRRAEFQGKRAQLMLALIDRDGYGCKQCGTQDDLTIDHIVPVSKGGSDDPDNLQLLCQNCNSQKGDR